METKDFLGLRAVVILIIVILLWGFNHPAIKISHQGVSLIFASTLRFVVASTCGLIYCLRRREKIFLRDVMLLHGIMIHQYSVSKLSAFTFLTPMFGVFSGVLFLHKELTDSLIIDLPLVSAGIFLVNWRRTTVLLT
jgi:drug/metabolite transporter (DMT)-like permease